MKISAGQILALGGVIIAGFVVFAIVRAARAAPGTVGSALGEVGGFFNPLDSRNAINRLANNLGDVIDNAEDDDSFSIGSFIFDLFSPEFDPNAPTEVPLTEIDLTTLSKERTVVFTPPTG